MLSQLVIEPLVRAIAVPYRLLVAPTPLALRVVLLVDLTESLPQVTALVTALVI